MSLNRIGICLLLAYQSIQPDSAKGVSSKLDNWRVVEWMGSASFDLGLGDKSTVAVSDAIRPFPNGVPLEFTFSRRLTDGLILVSNVENPVLSAWKATDLKLDASRWNKTSAGIGLVANAYLGATTSRNSDVTDYFHSVSNALDLAAIEIVDNSPTEEEFVDLDKVIQELLDQERFQKARYGDYDSYFAATYEGIQKNARSCLAVCAGTHFSPDTILCSGVMIAPRVAMTARHGLDTIAPNEAISVVFDFTSDTSTNKPTSFQVDHVVKSSDESVDVAWLYFAQDLTVERLRLPVALSSGHVRVQEPLYIIGHPLQAFQSIRDNCYALYPYSVDKKELGRVMIYERRRVLESGFSEVLADRKWDVADDSVLRDAMNKIRGELPTAMDAIRQSYQDSGNGRYFNNDVRWNRLATIGSDSDTFDRDSGAPCFSRKSNQFVGLLVQGEPNGDYVARWNRHERVLPLEAIERQFRSQVGTTWPPSK